MAGQRRATWRGRCWSTPGSRSAAISSKGGASADSAEERWPAWKWEAGLAGSLIRFGHALDRDGGRPVWYLGLDAARRALQLSEEAPLRAVTPVFNAWAARQVDRWAADVRAVVGGSGRSAGTGESQVPPGATRPAAAAGPGAATNQAAAAPTPRPSSVDAMSASEASHPQASILLSLAIRGGWDVRQASEDLRQLAAAAPADASWEMTSDSRVVLLSTSLSAPVRDRWCRLATAALRGFFDAGAAGAALSDERRIRERFGATLRENYPEVSPAFLRFATTYWTLKVALEDAAIAGPDAERSVAHGALAVVELAIGSMFFPHLGMGIPPDQREADQRRTLEQLAPAHFDVASFMTGNPILLRDRGQAHGAGRGGCATAFVLAAVTSAFAATFARLIA